MVNLTYPEIAEITAENLPNPSVDALMSLRNQSCEATAQSGFKLQSQQKFLRRVLSPDSPTRSLLMVHGTGTGKTCTAIQVAEEYILRPEFQDKKVMVIASAAVQENFRTQIFDMNRVNVDIIAGTLESKQCTGRRYLDMMMRIETEPKNWNNPDTRDKLQMYANRMIGEFYEFMAYESFGNYIDKRLGGTEKDIDRDWVHENFDNRLLIVDEVHNIRESKDSTGIKGVTRALENLVKTAHGLVVVFLTATPMFDTYDEIIFYMNLFQWNDTEDKTKLKPGKKITDYFNPDATLKPGAPADEFRGLCQKYISFVKGENPFTFPFRLPPPKVITDSVETSFLGKAIGSNEELRYLSLVESQAQGTQLEMLNGSDREDNEEKRQALMYPTISVLPKNKTFNESFRLVGKQFQYTGTAFLSPTELPNHAAKFVTVIKSIQESTGVSLVYSNYVKMGARLFAMALEEHGFVPAVGNTVLANPSYTGESKGKYILLTSGASDTEISNLLALVKSSKNKDGSQVKVIVSSPIVSEGVDFRFVRQIHILDPWWNMSRIEQVVGRGLRTCSHQLLLFEDQNCTVYFHVVRTGDNRECFDEYTYRTKVVPKAMKIATVRKVLAESAMDCPLQNKINTLPEDWKNLEVEQRRPEGGKDTFRLYGMLAPTFDDTPDVSQCIITPSVEDPTHVRPLSTYLDVRDDILSNVSKLFIDKPIWDRDQLFAALRPYTKDVIVYNIQQAIQSGFRFKDSFGRPSVLESRGDLYALSPIGLPNGTVIERTTQPPVKGRSDIPMGEVKEEAAVEIAPDIMNIRRIELAVKLPGDAITRFSEKTINGYVFDHTFSDDEKRAYLKTRPDTLPFAERLYVPESEYIVLGEDTYDPPEPPAGSDRTNFREWNSALVSKFIENKDVLFTTVRNGKFTISKMEIQADGTVIRKRDKSGKKFEPVTCGTGENDKTTMTAFAKFVDKNDIGIPPNVKNNTQLCIYSELLAREEINCIWVTPEEMSVLYENRENKDAFTKEFRK